MNVDWMNSMTKGFENEEENPGDAHAHFTEARHRAGEEVQKVLDAVSADNDPAYELFRAFYAMFISYSQELIMDIRSKGYEHMSNDYTFSVGEAYGVSSIINHIMDSFVGTLEGRQGINELDTFSDSIHDQILVMLPALETLKLRGATDHLD